ncbi:hypothetical protein DCAR_0625621 [Daucus carota subsp. sativus]|uniref:Uncharacterized protein n=2 Tax=Daucus carota subsp. sativus TaxID=79200 RepID=A0A164WKL4_DAUCS|nr:PREDICTED: uncharacterized protein LOC108192905 [Daucus carota subsp. sativus]WOH06198.1 hypothetical protein DCAR_0625621 [Daucus carota subsp. sativus]
MSRHNHVMEDLIHDSCKIRKRGCSSSSSTSSKLHNYRFKRAILVGNKTRKGLGSRSSTPVPTWKTTSLLRSGGVVESPKYESSKSRPVSARKLAATLWEMNEMPKVIEEKMKIMKKKERLRSVVSGSLPPHLSDPSHSPVSERMDRSVAGSIQRRTPSVSQRHRLSLETVGQVDSRSSASLMEIETRSQAQTPSGPAIGVRTRLKDVSNALTTSRELLKIIVRIWSHNDPPTSSASLVSALHAELERTRLQVNRLIKEQLSEQNEINFMVKCFAKEKASWKSKQQQAVEAAIESIAGELDMERKLRRRSESFNKKLGRELADTKALLLKTVKDLESEKRAREVLEQVCDELAADIGGDRAEVEVLKRESAKAHEEVEREREMLQLADKLREERVQMKLSEAKHQFEEKNAVVDKLRNQLEAFLRPKKPKKKGARPVTTGDNDEIPTYLKRMNFDFDQNDDKDDGEVENEIDTDEDSRESDLHSIELNMDNNNKSFKWNHTSTTAHDTRRVSVDDKMRGRNSISGDVPRKITLIQRSVSDGVEWGGHTKTMQQSGDALNQERIVEFEKQTPRKGYGDDLQRYKSVKGLRDQILSSSRTGSAGEFPSPVRQLAQSRHPNDPVQLVQERLPVVQGSGSKSRLVEARGEGQMVRRSRR